MFLLNMRKIFFCTYNNLFEQKCSFYLQELEGLLWIAYPSIKQDHRELILEAIHHIEQERTIGAKYFGSLALNAVSPFYNYLR
jgi:hypothetical protein